MLVIFLNIPVSISGSKRLLSGAQSVSKLHHLWREKPESGAVARKVKLNLITSFPHGLYISNSENWKLLPEVPRKASGCGCVHLFTRRAVLVDPSGQVFCTPNETKGIPPWLPCRALRRDGSSKLRARRLIFAGFGSIFSHFATGKFDFILSAVFGFEWNRVFAQLQKLSFELNIHVGPAKLHKRSRASSFVQVWNGDQRLT